MSRSLFLKGPVIGLPDEIPFRCDREYTFCRLCGDIFQPELERVSDREYTKVIQRRSLQLQKMWSDFHNRRHSAQEHLSLERSGRFLTPEATMALVPYGVIPLSDLVSDSECAQAGLEAPRMSDFSNYEWEARKRALL